MMYSGKYIRFLLLVLFCAVPCLGAASCVEASWHGKDVATLAVIKDPVVDLFTELPLQERAPLAGAAYADGACRRAHQVLANEVVTILERQGQHFKIACDNAVYGLQDGIPLNTFWIHKKHLIFLKQLDEEQLSAIPGPLGMVTDTVVVHCPWEKYSYGTRFVRDPERDTADSYGIKNIDPHTRVVQHMVIAHEVARIEQIASVQEKRNCFVQSAYELIRSAQFHGACHEVSEPRVIPYVWGGSSFVYGYHDTFHLKHNRWERPGKHTPYMGYDCSELILRLGQSCGIPLVAKTTTMLAQMLKPLTRSDALEAGDIIWFPGHVIIISDIERDEMIEARGYKSGYGRVHCLKLSKCFRGIKNYRQLRQAYFRKRPLVRLKKDGSVENVIKEFKLLKLL